MNDLPLITKYRPINFKEVLGNELAVTALADAVRNPVSRPHCYLLTGESGIGKTTLARIIAKEIDAFVIEMCAATNSSVDDTRKMVEFSGFKPVSQVEKNQMYIVDECHNLSDKAWEPLLKLIEEPPPFLYFALCTTEAKSIKATIKNRSYSVALRPLKSQVIESLITDVAALEGWSVNGDVINAITQAADGSARQALSLLQAGHSLTNREELAQVLEEVESQESPVIKICQHLIKGGTSWAVIRPLLASIDNHEAATNHAINYLTAAMLKAGEEKAAAPLWHAISCLTEANSYNKKVNLCSAIGKILWG